MEKVAQSGSARPTQSGLGRGPDWVTRRFALGGRRPPRSNFHLLLSLPSPPRLPGTVFPVCVPSTGVMGRHENALICGRVSNYVISFTPAGAGGLSV